MLAPTLRDITTTATTGMSKSVETSRGQIHHYTTAILPPSASGSTEPVKDWFEQLKRQNIPSNNFYLNVRLPENLLLALLLDGLALATIVVYLPRALAAVPYSSIALRAVRPSLSQPERTEYLWLGTDKTHYLRTLVIDLRQALFSQTSDSGISGENK